jgi:hypothetical protein
LVVNAAIMPCAVSTPIKERICGARVYDSNPVPDPISRTSRAVSGESIYEFEGWVWIDVLRVASSERKGQGRRAKAL